MESKFQEDINLRRYVYTYFSYIKSISFLAIFFLALWLAYVTFSPKLFEVKSLIQIEDTTTGTGIDELLSQGNDINLEEEVAIYTSRSNLGELVEKLKLNILVLDDFAEKNIDVTVVDYSFDYSEDAISLKIINKKDEKYDLLDSSNAFLGTDLSFGQLQNIDGIKIEINKLKEFDEVSLLVSNPEIIIDTLQASFSFGEIIQSRFMNYGKTLLDVSFIGPNVNQAKLILDTANEIFIERDISLKRESANTALSFLDNQIDIVGRDLEEAKVLLNEFLLMNDSFDLNSETEIYADQFKQITQQIQLINLKLAESSSDFKLESSIGKKLVAQKDLLADELEKLNEEVKNLPKIQQDYLTFLNQVDIQNVLFENLSSLKLEYSVRQASTIADARVIDSAYFYDQVAPRELNTLFIFFLLGLFTSIVYVSLFELFFKRINNVSDFISLFSDNTLLGVLTFVDAAKNRKNLADDEEYAYDMEVISVGLDTYLRKNENKSNVILVTSATENTGKTTFSHEFSKLYSKQFDKKICLIDCDYKRGDLNEKLGKRNLNSLDELFSKDLQDFKINENLFFIPRASKSSGKFMQMINSIKFNNFLSRIKKEFDIVILDGTPILGNSDALATIQHVDSIVFIVKHLTTKLNDFKLALSSIDDITEKDINFVYNFHKKQTNTYGYSYSYKYNYSYRYENKNNSN